MGNLQTNSIAQHLHQADAGEDVFLRGEHVPFLLRDVLVEGVVTLPVLVVELEVHRRFLHALHVPEVDLIEVGAGEPDSPLRADDGELGHEVRLIHGHRRVKCTDSPVLEPDHAGDGIVHFQATKSSAQPLVLDRLSEEIVQHVHIVRRLGVHHAAVELARSVPVDVEIGVVAVPEHVAAELVDRAELPRVDELLHHLHDRVVAVLVHGDQPFPRLLHATEHFIRFTQS